MAEDIWRRDQAITAAHEADYIVGKFRDNDIPVGYATNDDGDILYMYVKGQLLTREQFLGGVAGPEPTREAGTQRPKGVLDVLEGTGLPGSPVEIQIDRVIGDVVRLNLPGIIDVPDDDPPLGAQSAPAHRAGARRRIRDAGSCADRGRGHGPDGTLSGHRAPGSVRPVAALSGGLRERRRSQGADLRGRHRIAGGRGRRFPVAAGCEGRRSTRGPGRATRSSPMADTGHSWPESSGAWRRPREIYVANVFDIAGSAVESDVGIRLNGALALRGRDHPLDGIASPSRNNVPMMAMEAWLEQLPAYKGVVCVAAAGNNGNRLPCWPAAFDQVLSVGALASDWRSRAYFSNFGGWVDVYAPGQNLVNAYATGTYTCVICALCRREADILRHGAVERDVLLDPDRDRADRDPDVPLRRERPGSGRGPAGRGPGAGGSRRGTGATALLRRRRAVPR